MEFSKKHAGAAMIGAALSIASAGNAYADELKDKAEHSVGEDLKVDDLGAPQTISGSVAKRVAALTSHHPPRNIHLIGLAEKTERQQEEHPEQQPATTTIRSAVSGQVAEATTHQESHTETHPAKQEKNKDHASHDIHEHKPYLIKGGYLRNIGGEHMEGGDVSFVWTPDAGPVSAVKELRWTLQGKGEYTIITDHEGEKSSKKNVMVGGGLNYTLPIDSLNQKGYNIELDTFVNGGPVHHEGYYPGVEVETGVSLTLPNGLHGYVDGSFQAKATDLKKNEKAIVLGAGYAF